MSATDTLGQLGCMWLACHKPSSGQWTNVRTMKLKDTVVFTVAVSYCGAGQSSPVRQYGPIALWYWPVRASHCVGRGFESWRWQCAVHTDYCPHQLSLTLVRLSRRGSWWNKFAMWWQPRSKERKNDGAEVGQKSEVVMKKPQEARATPRPEHLLCSSNSTTYHLPMLSTSVALSEIHQT